MLALTTAAHTMIAAQRIFQDFVQRRITQRKQRSSNRNQIRFMIKKYLPPFSLIFWNKTMNPATSIRGFYVFCFFEDLKSDLIFFNIALAQKRSYVLFKTFLFSIHRLSHRIFTIEGMQPELFISSASADPFEIIIIQFRASSISSVC